MSKVFKVVTDSTFEPFTLSEAKDLLRVDFSSHDDLILSIIKGARASVEQFCGIGITLKTVEQRYNAFEDCMQLTFGNVAEVESVKYLDNTDTEQVCATTIYGADLFKIPSEVYLKPNQTWPTTSDDRGAVRIRYKSGYANASAIPEDLKLAMRLIIADVYANPEDSVRRFPTAATNYMELHRQKFFV